MVWSMRWARAEHNLTTTHGYLRGVSR
jgi:hypothetical protein